MHVLLLLAVSCYGLPINDQKNVLSRSGNDHNDIHRDAIYQMDKSLTSGIYSHNDNNAKRLNLLPDNVFQSNPKRFKDSDLTLAKRETDLGINDQQIFNQGGIASDEQSQESLDETLLQDEFNATWGAENTLNLIFQNINQSDIRSNNKKIKLSNTATDVSTEQYWRSNEKMPTKKEISDNDQNYATSYQGLTQGKSNPVNESNSVIHSELIKFVFGSRPETKNDNSSKKKEQEDKEDIVTNENENNIKTSFFKEVFGKNWDKENKPINQENLDPILKITLDFGSHDADKDIANNHNRDKAIEPVLRDVFGNIWDIENKPISQKNVDKYLNLFESYSDADTILDHAVEDEHSNQDQNTLQNGWVKDYNQRYLSSGYRPWIRHSSQRDVEHDEQFCFGNGPDSHSLLHSGVNHDDVMLTNFLKGSLNYDHDSSLNQGQYYHSDRQ